MYLVIHGFKKTVTTAGTAERLTDNDFKVDAVCIQALAANTNDAYIGDNQVDKDLKNGHCLDARESITFTAKDLGMADAKISLRDIWVDVDTSSEGVVATYFIRAD